MIFLDTCSFCNISPSFIKKCQDIPSNQVAVSSCAFGISSVLISISYLSLKACSCCLKLSCMLHGICASKSCPNRTHLEHKNLQNFPCKNYYKIIYMHLLCLPLLWFSFLFYSIREMSVVPHCMEEQKHLIFSTVHLCSIRYLPRLWGPLHSTAESQPELDQRFFLVQHPVSDSAKMPENKSRTNSAFKGFASSSTEYSRMLTSFDWLLMLCLMQPRVGFGLWAARAHTLLTQTEPAAGSFLGPAV